jgi:hypothetical protein
MKMRKIKSWLLSLAIFLFFIFLMVSFLLILIYGILGIIKFFIS